MILKMEQGVTKIYNAQKIQKDKENLGMKRETM